MFLDFPSVLLNLVLFVPNTHCFAVVGLRATKDIKILQLKISTPSIDKKLSH